ncbi:MAG: tetratricopeptide repeat protein [Lachnospiraceae bacterium]|nr:tetratricopeptide repeat protein [Lachnospiraceae bacterium]
MELDDKLYFELTELCEEGDNFIEEGDINEAIDKYKKALELIPNPKYEWEASTWVYGALGDAYYLNDQYEEAIVCLAEVLKCPDGLENPFIILRIGQCYFEIENYDKAEEYLLQAYMLEGEEIFEDEEEKYMDLIRNKI